MEVKKAVVVHVKDPYDIYIGRPSHFGNPFAMYGSSARERQEVIAKFTAYLKARPKLIAEIKRVCKGQRLGCYCAPNPCHGDVIAAIANGDLEL